MAERHAMGVMADPDELLGALQLLGAIDRLATQRELRAAQLAAVQS